MASERAVRESARAFLERKLAARGVALMLAPKVWHGKGPLSDNLGRHVNLDPIRSLDHGFDHDLEYMEVEPDLIALCNARGNVLIVLGECKAKGRLSVSDLAQVLLYSSVCRATASVMFFTGSPSRPVRRLLEDEVLRYHGYDANRNMKEKLIGFYRADAGGSFTKLWPNAYDVLDV